MKVGQEVYFVREKPPKIYNYEKPEPAIIKKIAFTNLHVEVLTTGVVHRFNMETLRDCSYTSHKLFLTCEALTSAREDK